MEPRPSLGTLICVFVAIAFGVYCLYPSAVLNRRGDEVHRGPTHDVGSFMGQSQPQRSGEQHKQPSRTSVLAKRPLE
jgi:hypothetical protein